MIFKFSTVCCLVLLLAGCTASRPPSYNLPSADSITPGAEYTVGRNENIYAIAQKEGVRLRDIIALNQLQPPFALRAGQVITLPAKDQFAAPTPRAAPLEPIDKGYMGPASDGNGGAAPFASGVQSQELPPLSGSSVSSAPISSMSDKPKELAPTQPKTTWTGLPQAVAATPEPTKPLTPVQAASTPQPEPTASATASSPTESLPPQQTETIAEPPAQQATPAPQQQAATGGADPVFGWPVRGTIISAFGPKGQGLDNDGINISAPKGSPVKAAEGGIVAYAGNEMKGFGNLVLIRHENKWVTAYAHLDRLMVTKDSIVAKGDMIGTIGTTGGVSSPQLHFETRQDGRPVDPELMIK